MKPILSVKNNEFLRIKYVPNQFNPIIEYREIEKKKVGTWLFGLLPIYRYFYSKWKQHEINA